MKIDKEDLEEFKRLYKDEYGRQLTEAEASEIAGNLVSLYELLSEPLPCEIRPPSATEKRPASPSQQ